MCIRDSPKYLAADLMSQAEHDVLASAILLTTSSKIAEETIAQIYEQVERLERKDIINKSLDDFGACLLYTSVVGVVRCHY